MFGIVSANAPALRVNQQLAVFLEQGSRRQTVEQVQAVSLGLHSLTPFGRRRSGDSPDRMLDHGVQQRLVGNRGSSRPSASAGDFVIRNASRA